MYNPHFIRILLVLLIAAGPILVNAQCLPLETLYARDNGQDGIMFDIEAVVDVTITGFDCNLGDPDPYDIVHKSQADVLARLMHCVESDTQYIYQWIHLR